LLFKIDPCNIVFMKILMVCLGNICRSPLAQGILEHKCIAKDLNWSVDSAGTSGWHEDDAPDPRSIKIAQEHDIDISDQRSRKFVSADFDRFDLILTMDADNYNNVLKLSPTEKSKDKVKMILNYVFPGENRKVPDPYYDNNFDRVYGLLDSACDKIIEKHI